jgi:hypothetical protein
MIARESDAPGQKLEPSIHSSYGHAVRAACRKPRKQGNQQEETMVQKTRNPGSEFDSASFAHADAAKTP